MMLVAVLYALFAQVVMTSGPNIDQRCGFARYEPLVQIVSEGDQVTFKPHVEYPAEAAKRGVSGTVRVRVVVNRSGRVVATCTVILPTEEKPDSALIDAARSAARQWRFKPDFGLPRSAGIEGRYMTQTVTIVFDKPRRN